MTANVLFYSFYKGMKILYQAYRNLIA